MNALFRMYLGWLFLKACLYRVGGDEVFTSVADMQSLLETESSVLKLLKSYIATEEDRLKTLKLIHKELTVESAGAIKDAYYHENPVNAFKIIKRLTVDLNAMINLTLHGTECSSKISDLKKTMKFPTNEDIQGAAIGLVRLQDTYKLDTSEISQGMLNGIKYSKSMNANECYELGRQLHDLKDYNHSKSWMMEAFKKQNMETKKTVKKSDVLHYLKVLNSLTGNVITEAELETELLKESSEHLKNFKKSMEKSHEATLNKEYRRYEALCREDLQLPENMIKKLKCRYVSNTHPFLLIAPLKLEECYIHPYIVVYHDAMYDREIKFIQKTAQPGFKRASVKDGKGSVVPAQYRISKSAWLTNDEGSLLKHVNQRTSDMTGLLDEESLQVVNYGIGGHYLPHFDFNSESHGLPPAGEVNNNVLATVLFYLSDVAQGGGTVFTELGIGVKPKRGTAVFWLNLHPSGEGNHATKHAACPVLQGSKWVSNKWIHQLGQELSCNLEYQPEGLLKKYPKPILKSHLRNRL